MTTKKRIYVAGPMTGIKDYNQQAFRNITEKGARLELSRAIAGNLEIIYELDYMQNGSAYTSRRAA